MRYLSLFVLVLFLASCLDEFTLPKSNNSTQLVVEGLLTNDPQTRFLKLSTTTDLKQNTSEPLQGAKVWLSWQGGSIAYKHSNVNIGYYLPILDAFTPKTGTAYTINIQIPDGRTFVSKPQVLLEAVPVSSLKASYKQSPFPSHQIDLNFKDPNTKGDHYRWISKGYYQRKTIGVPVPINTFCCQRCWVEHPSNGGYLSDQLVNGSDIKDRNIMTLPVYMTGKNLVSVSQYRMSQETYQFWLRFDAQKNRTGSIFDALPAALSGNIENGSEKALGFFEVSSVSHFKYTFIGKITNEAIANFDQPLFIPDGDCMKAFENASYIETIPEGF